MGKQNNLEYCGSAEGRKWHHVYRDARHYYLLTEAKYHAGKGNYQRFTKREVEKIKQAIQNAHGSIDPGDQRYQKLIAFPPKEFQPQRLRNAFYILVGLKFLHVEKQGNKILFLNSKSVKRNNKLARKEKHRASTKFSHYVYNSIQRPSKKKR